MPKPKPEPDPVPEIVKTEIIPIIPTIVESVVKKELEKKDLSWVRKDYIVIGVLFIVLAVLSTVQVISLNRIERTTQNTDLIAECTTPGTRCFKLSAEHEAENRVYLQKVAKSTGICAVLTSAALNTGEIPLEEETVNLFYTQCIDDRAGPPPPVLPPPLD